MSSEAEKKGGITTKQKLIVAGIILFLLLSLGIVIYYNGRAAGKRKGGITINTTPVDPGGTTASSSQTEIKSIAAELYQDMKGANALGHSHGPWKRWLALSDTDFIRVGNEFNMQYQQLSGENLSSWVEGEQSWTDPSWIELKNTALIRMNKLSMK